MAIKQNAFLVFVFFVSIYLLTSSGTNIHATDASLARYEVTRSIVERFDLAIPDGAGMKGADGRDYSWYGLGWSILAVPFYAAGKCLGDPGNAVSIMNQLFGAATATLVFLFAISLGYSRQASLLTSFIYGLGTFAWPLAKQPFDHTVEAFFILFSVYSIHRYGISRKILPLFLSATSIGMAFVTRPTSLLAMPSLLLMLCFSARKAAAGDLLKTLTRDIILFSFSFLPFLGLALWYNYYRFGSPFETGFTLMAARTGLNFFTGTSFLTGLAGFIISPGKGFLYYSPVAILFFFSIRPFSKRHPELVACFLSIILLYPLVLSRNVYWHGDWAWGPRYLLAITPFVILPVAELIHPDIRPKIPFLRAFVYMISGIGLVVQLAAVFVDFQKYFQVLSLDEGVKFTVVSGIGVMPIVEPSPETYFSWRRSPILAQMGFIRDAIHNMKNYHYQDPAQYTNMELRIKSEPYFNVPDFWWVYKYFVEGSFAGIAVAVLLFFQAFVAARRLLKNVSIPRAG